MSNSIYFRVPSTSNVYQLGADTYSNYNCYTNINNTRRQIQAIYYNVPGIGLKQVYKYGSASYEGSGDTYFNYVNFFNYTTLKTINFQSVESINTSWTSMANNSLGQPAVYKVVNSVLEIQSPAKNFYFNSNMANSFTRCYNLNINLQEIPSRSFSLVNNLYGTFVNCYNLTGSPVCGDNVISMASAYARCNNLTGSPVCGNNVMHLNYAYISCYNLTGSPVCGNNVINMTSTYASCYNLTGSPACGKNVLYLSSAYFNCYNLTNVFLNLESVTYCSNCFNNCRNMYGYITFNSNVVDLRNFANSCHNLDGIYFAKNNYALNETTRNTYLKGLCGNRGGNLCNKNITIMANNYSLYSALTMTTVNGIIGAATTWTKLNSSSSPSLPSSVYFNGAYYTPKNGVYNATYKVFVYQI